MNWELIESIQKETGMRLITPFRLPLKLGDVVSVNRRDGTFTIEGTSESILDIPVAGIRPAESVGVDLYVQSGKNVSVKFRAAGEASSVFDKLPHATAGVDVAFGSAGSWLLAIVNRQITALDDLNPFRQAILTANHWKVWKPDWALVNSVATVDRITLLVSTENDTNVAMNLSTDFASAIPLEVQLTSGVSIAATSKKLLHSVVTKPSSAFCTALKVHDRFFSESLVETLSDQNKAGDSSTVEFWEDLDSFVTRSGF